MAATYGTLNAVGLKSGRTYTLDVYIPDAVATYLGFAPTGLSGTASPTNWRAPEDIVITDVSEAGAPTAVGATFQVNGANIAGGSIRHANQIYSAAFRPKLSIPVRGGDFVSALQW